MKFKKGDKVRIKDISPINCDMRVFIGKITYVTKITGSFYTVNCDNGRFIWNNRQLEKIN